MSISTEQALDMMPHVVEVYEKVGFKTYLKKAKEKNKGKKVDVEEAGLEAVMFVVKNINKAKKDIFEVVAIAENKSVEDVRKQPLTKTIASIKNIFQDEELNDFFKVLMQ